MRRPLSTLTLTVAALLVPATAQAEISFLSSFGSVGAAAGQLSNPAGLAVNNANSNVYVADRGNNRVEQFNANGAFVRAWGYDVVSSGAGNKPFANEVQEVAIRATSGSFSLRFKGAETAQLPFNATAVEVQAALNALATVSSGGGSVAVTGGPGDETATSPYVVTFSGGPLAQTNIEALEIEPSGLGVPAGTELSCEAEPNPDPGFDSGGFEIDYHPEYRWLANGSPVSGATTNTFIPGPAEEGKAIQCEATLTFGGVKVMEVSRPYLIASPAPAALPPLGPALLAAPIGTPFVESAGGNSLACSAGSWTRNPEVFTYRWYRNGVEIGSATGPTSETANEYVLTQKDVATQAVFQCAVTGENAGGASTSISKFLSTSPEQKEPQIRNAAALVMVAASGRSETFTRTNGGAPFEVCKSGETCKAGVAGPGFGQFNQPRSIAVDNSLGGGGAVWVMDDGNPRVQKFSAEGLPILEVGGEVNLTTHANLCTVASGNACGPGVTDTLSGIGADHSTAGFFGGVLAQENSGEYSELGNELAVDAAGNLYVGDQRREGDFTPPRIEKFDSGGSFLGQVKIPFLFSNEVNLTPRPFSVAADSNERAYATTPGEPGAAVIRFLPSLFSLGGEGPVRAGNVFEESGHPIQLAIDPRNDRVLVSDRNSNKTRSICGGPQTISGRAILEFDAGFHQLDCTAPAGLGALPRVTGLAVSPANNRLLVAVGLANLIKIFKLPTASPPAIGAQSATDITTESARLHAQVNPGFEDTTYSYEYGLEDCESSSCETVAGGTLYGLKFTDGATQIEGLEPNTTYHYRVVAESPLGTVKGPDRTFTTFPLIDLVNDPCPNALARKQTKTVGLLDCRAYELASAAFTGGYDVVSDLVSGLEPFQGFPDAQDRLLYGVKDGGIPGTGNPTNRGIDPYVASRNEDGTWSTTYVGIPSDNPFATSPFSSTLAGADGSLDAFAFAGEICDPCFADGSSGLPVRLPSGELVQGMTGSSPDPSAEPAGYVAKQLSADGSHLIFGTDAKLEPTANEGGDATIYSRDLGAGTTEVVSTDEAGNAISGTEVGALDVSADGSRVLIGQEVATDGAGNPLWHLYLHLSGDANSVDLMPAAVEGAYFAGMTTDAGRVFFTTEEQLLPEDTDESADIYEAEVDPEGNLSERLVSTDSEGNASNSDSCTPSNEPATWNSPSGNGKCGALAFAGGAGVASSSGELYFASPELLDEGQGTANQPNLYRVAPDGNPSFVATIDTSVGKPGPKPPEHPLLKANFSGETYFAVQALTVDQATHDLYAIEPFLGKVYRYDQSGAPKEFTAGPHTANALTGLSFEAFAPSSAEVAVDNKSTGVLAGAIYVATTAGVKVFAGSGEELGTLDGSGANKGAWTTNACGVSVDQSNGTLYVADLRGYLWQYTPNSPTAPLTDADYTVKGLKPEGMTPCALAADSGGRVYAAKATDGPVKRFLASSFVTGAPLTSAGAEIDAAALALAVDPATNDLYVDEGDRIAVFDSSGEPTASIGEGKLACGEVGSRGVAVDKTSHHVFASCFAPSQIKEFGYEVPPYTPVDNPAILGAAHPLTHRWSDFQVTPDGEFAAFATTRPLKAGYDNASHYEVYRYDSSAEELLCISCDTTEAQAQSDSTLPPHGLGLLADGRVFFNTAEQLTLSDTNEKLDAYEYAPQREGTGGCELPQGCRQLISTGTSAYPAGMLGVSRDGTDAFFFTREVLVGEDRNGQAMKLYDARSEGGRFVIAPDPPCAASDECHGPGTQAAPAPQVGTLNGTGGQFTEEASAPPKTCKKPKVRRKGRCVKPHHKKHRHRKAAHKRGRQ
jgi:hypothetical protein